MVHPITVYIQTLLRVNIHSLQLLQLHPSTLSSILVTLATLLTTPQSVPVSFSTTPSSSALGLLLSLAQLLLLGSSRFDGQQQEDNQNDVMDKVELGVTRDYIVPLHVEESGCLGCDVKAGCQRSEDIVDKFDGFAPKKVWTEQSPSLENN